MGNLHRTEVFGAIALDLLFGEGTQTPSTEREKYIYVATTAQVVFLD